MRLRISPQADDDLSEIGRYIAQEHRNPEAARHLLDSIMETLLLLPQFPSLGKCCTDFDDRLPGLMTVTIEGYLLYYQIHGTTIDVLRVVHSRRDRRRALEN